MKLKLDDFKVKYIEEQASGWACDCPDCESARSEARSDWNAMMREHDSLIIQIARNDYRISMLDWVEAQLEKLDQGIKNDSCSRDTERGMAMALVIVADKLRKWAV